MITKEEREKLGVELTDTCMKAEWKALIFYNHKREVIEEQIKECIFRISDVFLQMEDGPQESIE